MFKKAKKISAAVLSAVMMLTAVATPLGDNLPAVRDSVSVTASAASNPFGKWQTINGVTTIRCTYYAWQQAYDNTGVALPMLGNGCQWYNNAKNAGYSVGTTAKAKSIAVWGSCSNNSYGHVAYVVSVNGNKMTVNEGGRSDATSSNGIVNGFSCGSTIGSKRYSGSPLIGFIYLDSTSSSDDVKLLNTSSHYTDEVYDDNAIVHGEVNKPTSYPVTRIGIQVRKDGNTYSNGWSRFDNTQKTYTNSSWMSPWFNIKTELGVTLVHSTRYYYQFYAVVNGKEYWSSENTFVTTGSHSYGSWYTTTSATCTSGGTEERKCSCGAVETSSTSALGHNYGSTYYEAAHPHKYAHLCQRCGYKEFTGGNLDYYYLCATCTHLTKPEITKITGDLVDNSEITIEWTASESDKLANYWLDVFDPDGLNVVDVSTGKINSYTFTPVKTGTYTIKTYAAPIGNKDGSGSVGAETTIEIGCNHNYNIEVVNPTFDREGYTQYTCTKCGYSYNGDYTNKLTLANVSGLKAKSKSSTSITLQWNKNASASGYEIQQYKGDKWVRIGTVGKNFTVTYTVKGLKAGTAGYQFRVRAYKTVDNSKVYGGYSSTLKVNTNPYGVGGFKCSSKSSTSVTLKWNKGTTASGYQLQQYKNGKWVTIYTGTKATNTSYTVKNLKAGTAGYRFKIRAYKTYGSTKQYSSWSSEIKVNTNPYGVSGFKCSSKTSTSVTLKWNKGTTASGYQLQQYKNGKWVTIYTGTKATSTSYTVKNLKAGTAGYRFRIRAYKTYGSTKQYSSWSSEVKVNTNPYGVGGFKAKSTAKTSVKLGWNKGTTASGYQLQQYKNGKWVTIYTGTKATSTSYIVKGLKANTSYKFRIRAYKTYGSTKQYSSWSSTLTVKTKK